MEFSVVKKYVKQATSGKMQSCWAMAISLILMLFVVDLLFLVINQILMTVTQTEFWDKTFRAQLTRTGVAITIYIFLLSQVVMIPLRFGVKSWFMKVGNTVSHREAGTKAFVYFGGFKEYIKCMAIKIVTSIRIILTYVLFLTPAFAINIIMIVGWYEAEKELNFLFFAFAFFAIILFIIGAIIATVYSLNLFMVDYLFIRFEDIGIIKSLKCSSLIMSSRKGELFKIFLCILPQLLSCVLIIPIVFALPYIKKFYAEYALGVINEEYDNITEFIYEKKVS